MKNKDLKMTVYGTFKVKNVRLCVCSGNLDVEPLLFNIPSDIQGKKVWKECQSEREPLILLNLSHAKPNTGTPQALLFISQITEVC